ncbi:DUF1684 domain-containing protein [Fibrella aquatica]|uniref:DUF1684 domain-containing protein n=1 Tax=Fibrella aquatica TaxID=3242487 RepID=UPI0035206B01
MANILKKPIFWLITLPVLAAVIWLFMLPDQANTATVDPVAYRAELQAERDKKDEYMRTNAESPIPDKATFKGLTYFEADPSFRVMAKLEPFPEGKAEKLVIKLTDGTDEIYEKYAHATFTVDNKACRLLVLKFQNSLSVLFQDATSGQQTYGGGRYIDIDLDAVANNQVVIDFNAAYSPYCAYNPSYACPLPPPENKLPVAIKAGEQYVQK